MKMKIIKKFINAILRLFKVSSTLAPAIAIETTDDSCRSCYVCQSGVISSITPSEFREATKNGGGIPDEWFTDADQCGICVSCEKCFSGQEITA
jgi:hypothetical protein